MFNDVFIQGTYVYEFTANDFNEVKTAVQQDIIAPSASALKHKLQVIRFGFRFG